MRLTPRQLQTTSPHPPVTMVRCMAPDNPQNPVRPSVRPPSVRPPSVRPSGGADGVQNADGGAGWHVEWQATPIRRGRVAAGCVGVTLQPLAYNPRARFVI